MAVITEIFKELVSSHSVGWMIGQPFGAVAIVLGFITYQMRTQRSLILVQSTVIVAFCIHYFLIGAYSGMAINAVCLIRNAVYTRRLKTGARGKTVPIIFVLIQCAMCVLTWEAWYSVLVMAGIGIHTYFLSLDDPQRLKKSIFVTSPMVLAYDVLVCSIGGVIFESVAIISSFIGVMKSRKEK